MQQVWWRGVHLQGSNVTHPAELTLHSLAPPLPSRSLQVLQVAKQLRMWSAEDGEATYYDLLTQVGAT